MCLVSFSKTEQYSALKKLDNKRLPAWAYVVITDACSHKCPWCYGGFNGELAGHMSLQTFKVVIGKLKEMGVFQVSLAGGEPTEHPHFREFVLLAAAEGFLLHIVSHGEHIDVSMAQFLKEAGVEQVQVNWQGSRLHDEVHGVPGSHKLAVAALRNLAEVEVETTTTTTVGKYNLGQIDQILGEAASLGVTRLRVWEATGRGMPFMRGLEAVEIFDRCREAARELGYTHCLSYDPDYEGDVTVPCLQFSNLYMYVSSRATLDFCGAVPDGPQIADFLDPSLSGEDIRQLYLRVNADVLGDRPIYCASRDGLGGVRPVTVPLPRVAGR